MDRPRILLACPVSDHKKYIIYKWIKHLKRLSWKCDILLIDNSSDPLFYRTLIKSHTSVAHVQPPERSGIRAVMAMCNEMIRRYVVSQGYDFLFSLECDVFPPSNIIEHLLSIPGPVKAASYFSNVGKQTVLLGQEIEQDTLYAIARPFNVFDGFLFCDGTIKQVYQPALGCTLIHRSILEKTRFYTTNEDTAHADSYFFRDLFFMGVPVLQDTSVICDHENQNWDEIYKKEKIWN